MSRKARLLSRAHGVDFNGVVWAFPHDGATPFPICNTGFIQADYRHVFEAAPMMFLTIAQALPVLDTLTNILEQRGVEEPVASLLQLQADLRLVERAALEGVIELSMKTRK